MGLTGVALLLAGAAGWSLRPRAVLPSAAQPAQTMRTFGMRDPELARAPDSQRRPVVEPQAGSGAAAQVVERDPTRMDPESPAAAPNALQSDLGGPSFELDLVLPPGVSRGELVAELLTLDQAPWAPGSLRTTSTGRARVRAGEPPWVAFATLAPLSLTSAGGRNAHALLVMTDDGRHGALARVHALGGRYPVPVNLRLEPRGGLALCLRDSFGAGIARAEVSVAAGETGTLEFRTRTDAQGRARLDALAPGSWRLRVRAPEHSSLSQACEIVAGRDAQLEFVLDRLPTLGVAGHLWSRSGAELAPLPVRLLGVDDPQRRYFATPVADPERPQRSSFDFGQVPRGEYLLLPPADSPFAWEPPLRRVKNDETAADLERQDGGPTRRIHVRAYERETGARIERFQTTLLVDRYGLGTRGAAQVEAHLVPRLTTHAGRELGRSLTDGFLHLDLSYDPGRLRVEAEGWRVREWKGFRRGKPTAALDLYEIWLEPQG